MGREETKMNAKLKRETENLMKVGVRDNERVTRGSLRAPFEV
jgi:hypothetical protein